jgi:hypothetical protein
MKPKYTPSIDSSSKNCGFQVRLRGSQQWLVVGPIRSIRQQAEEGVADDGRKASQAIPAVGLPPCPADARQPPRPVGFRCVDGGRS